MGIFRKDIEQKVNELGYNISAVVPVYKSWSIIATKDNRKYNIHLDEKDLAIIAIYHLKYHYNESNGRILNVSRTPMGYKKTKKT